MPWGREKKRIMRRARVARGECSHCGTPRGIHASLCDGCAKRQTERTAKRGTARSDLLVDILKNMTPEERLRSLWRVCWRIANGYQRRGNKPF